MSKIPKPRVEYKTIPASIEPTCPVCAGAHRRENCPHPDPEAYPESFKSHADEIAWLRKQRKAVTQNV